MTNLLKTLALVGAVLISVNDCTASRVLSRAANSLADVTDPNPAVRKLALDVATRGSDAEIEAAVTAVAAIDATKITKLDNAIMNATGLDPRGAGIAASVRAKIDSAADSADVALVRVIAASGFGTASVAAEVAEAKWSTGYAAGADPTLAERMKSSATQMVGGALTTTAVAAWDGDIDALIDSVASNPNPVVDFDPTGTGGAVVDKGAYKTQIATQLGAHGADTDAIKRKAALNCLSLKHQVLDSAGGDVTYLQVVASRLVEDTYADDINAGAVVRSAAELKVRDEVTIDEWMSGSVAHAPLDRDATTREEQDERLRVLLGAREGETLEDAMKDVLSLLRNDHKTAKGSTSIRSALVASSLI